MKIYLALCLLFLCTYIPAQEKIITTAEFTISGQVRQEAKIALADLSLYEQQDIGNLKITYHLGTDKGTAKNMKGVLLKDILSKVVFQAESPKVLSEFYITCMASDGYKAVFSWNELFNTETGNHVYIVTEKEGVKAADMSERILLVSVSDFKTGRRYVKGLERIKIGRVQK